MNIRHKVLATLVCVTGMLCSYPGQGAPDEGKYVGRSISKLRSTHEGGFYATSLLDLIESADIVIEGRYGAFIRNFPFYGYADDGSDKPPRINSFGLPISEYEIIPSRVLKGGNLVSDPLFLRVVESAGQPRLPVIVAQRSGNHLFFFALNPDRRTVGLHGGMFDMKETATAYTFINAGEITTALDSGDKELFLKRVEAIIATETGVER